MAGSVRKATRVRARPAANLPIIDVEARSVDVEQCQLDEVGAS
jgi:hypothetical protein